MGPPGVFERPGAHLEAAKKEKFGAAQDDVTVGVVSVTDVVMAEATLKVKIALAKRAAVATLSQPHCLRQVIRTLIKPFIFCVCPRLPAKFFSRYHVSVLRCDAMLFPPPLFAVTSSRV